MNIPLETDSIYLAIIDSAEHLQAAFKIDGGLVNPCSYQQMGLGEKQRRSALFTTTTHNLLGIFGRRKARLGRGVEN